VPTQKGSNKLLLSQLSKEKIKKLSTLRVIQKTLVYVIGIAPEVASEDILKQPEYFGQYGDLQKVVINTNNVYNSTRGVPSYSAYLTFHHARESAIAILVNIFEIDHLGFIIFLLVS
jgi:CCR4-NOT transcription complex subunit 4